MGKKISMFRTKKFWGNFWNTLFLTLVVAILLYAAESLIIADFLSIIFAVEFGFFLLYMGYRIACSGKTEYAIVWLFFSVPVSAYWYFKYFKKELK